MAAMSRSCAAEAFDVAFASCKCQRQDSLHVALERTCQWQRQRVRARRRRSRLDDDEIPISCRRRRGVCLPSLASLPLPGQTQPTEAEALASGVVVRCIWNVETAPCKLLSAGAHVSSPIPFAKTRSASFPIFNPSRLLLLFLLDFLLFSGGCCQPQPTGWLSHCLPHTFPCSAIIFNTSRADAAVAVAVVAFNRTAKHTSALRARQLVQFGGRKAVLACDSRRHSAAHTPWLPLRHIAKAEDDDDDGDYCHHLLTRAQLILTYDARGGCRPKNPYILPRVAAIRAPTIYIAFGFGMRAVRCRPRRFRRRRSGLSLKRQCGNETCAAFAHLLTQATKPGSGRRRRHRRRVRPLRDRRPPRRPPRRRRRRRRSGCRRSRLASCPRPWPRRPRRRRASSRPPPPPPSPRRRRRRQRPRRRPPPPPTRCCTWRRRPWRPRRWTRCPSRRASTR